MTHTRETLKFDTGNAIFSKDYIKKSGHQKSYNTLVIEYLAEIIPSLFPLNNELSILDLCCGDGSATSKLLDVLLSKNINIKNITGYDISPEQIEIATNYTKENPCLTFEVMDVEKIDEQNRYDIVISLFGFHWLEQIQNLVPRIHRALKPEGTVMFLVPLEKEELFNLRQQCMFSPSWAGYFEGYILHPFHYSSLDYMEPFTEYFSPESGSISGEGLKKFTKEEFSKFLGSWLQEERYLRLKFGQQIAQQYIKNLVDNIQESYCERAYLSRDEDQTIQFIERYLFWQGKRKLEPSKTNELVNVPPLTPLQSSLTKNYIGFFNPKTFQQMENNNIPALTPLQKSLC